MKNNYIYYHICQLGDWKKVIKEQIEYVQSSGLYENVKNIFVSNLGNEEVFLPEKYQVIYSSKKIEEAELPILEKLHNHSQIEDFNVLYFHTKGVSWNEQGKNHACVNAWRKFMEYFVIGKWETCIEYLKEYDAVGVEWIYNSIFAGNFWWSKSEHIKNLSNIYELATPYGIGSRWSAEYWIGSKSKNIKCLFDYTKNLYDYEIKPSEYTP